MNDEVNKQKLVNIVKWGSIITISLIAAPIVFVLAKAALGAVIALGLAGLIAVAGIEFSPVIAMKLANRKVKEIVSEATSNPIETLYNQLAEKRQSSNAFKDSITLFRTEIKNFEQTTAQFKKQYPEDAERFEKQLSTMNQLLSFRESRYKQLQIELDNFDKAIARAQALWNMSQAAQKMNKLAGVKMADQFEKIKTDSAVNSVMNSVNKAFSEMETALLDNEEVQKAALVQLDQKQPQLLTMSIDSKEKV